MTDAGNSFANLLNSDKNMRKGLFAVRVKIDHDDYTKLKSWFKDHNLFEAGEGLIAIYTGLTDVEGRIIRDQAEEIGGTN